MSDWSPELGTKEARALGAAIKAMKDTEHAEGLECLMARMLTQEIWNPPKIREGRLKIADHALHLFPEEQRRQCAAVNDCQGIPTEALEAGVVRELIQTARSFLNMTPPLPYKLPRSMADCVDWRGQLEAALAKARPEEGKP